MNRVNPLEEPQKLSEGQPKLSGIRIQSRVRIISLLVMLVGIIVMVLWIFDLPLFTLIFKNSISMKFTTATSFFVSGILIFFIEKSVRGDRDLASVVIPVSTLIIVLIMVTIVAASALGIQTGIESWFKNETAQEVNTIFLGRPSVGAMIGFILVSLAGFFTLYNPKKIRIFFLILGYLIIFIGVVAVVGYIVRIPQLYYEIPNFSNSIALLTSVLFICIGYCFILLGQSYYLKSNHQS